VNQANQRKEHLCTGNLSVVFWCGEVSEYGYWGPQAMLFSAPGVIRAAHILDIHGQLDPDGGELPETAPPALDQDYASSTWAGWGDAAGCYTVRVSAQTEQTLAQPIGGKTVKTYAYSQTEGDLATRCAGLDLTLCRSRRWTRA
jgi:hypothetical protein